MEDPNDLIPGQDLDHLHPIFRLPEAKIYLQLGKISFST